MVLRAPDSAARSGERRSGRPHPDVAITTADLDIELGGSGLRPGHGRRPRVAHADDALVRAWISRFQRNAGIVGDVFEIGAYLGKTAILLGYLTAPRASRRCDVSRTASSERCANRNEATTYYRGLQQAEFERNYLRLRYFVAESSDACPLTATLPHAQRWRGFPLGAPGR